MNPIASAIRSATLIRRTGRVSRLVGLTIEADGPDAAIGDICEVYPKVGGTPVPAQVVGVTRTGITLMPFASTDGLAAGGMVAAQGRPAGVAVGDALLGRVIDAFGMPLDGLGAISCAESVPLVKSAPKALDRPRITAVFETGVRAIDGLLTLGRGQRVGIFAGSGVGKSSLLGMICKASGADVNVIALVGERGREVKSFVEDQLGPEGLAHSVVVVATSDQPALTRIRAAYAAVSIAEYFRDRGQHVLLTMDSVTRLAMARREVGLAAGEPPTARGYTPSVFTEIPELCERCGTSASGGAISAIFTVLVDGDDFNEPVSDALRATLDGHIVLSRDLAHEGHFPAIDVLASVSRLASELCAPDERTLALSALENMAVYAKNRQLVDIGAYQPGANASIDSALSKAPRIVEWLKQSAQITVSRGDALRALQDILTHTDAVS